MLRSSTNKGKKKYLFLNMYNFIGSENSLLLILIVTPWLELNPNLLFSYIAEVISNNISFTH